METSSPETEAIQQAKEAGLRYTTDYKPGISRSAVPDGFAYHKPSGEPINDEPTLARIRKLAIPPAYQDVWICTTPNGHLQATGRDARGRKQYRYHTKWREARDEHKFVRMLSFGQDLPLIRGQVAADLALPGLPKQRVLATIVRLLETTLIRVGNEEYAKANKSYGLTTLKNKHVKLEGPQIRFVFKGKSHVAHDIDLKDRRMAGIIKKLQDLPGQDLFQYQDEDGQTHHIGSEEVNAYLQNISEGRHYTAKDFRTWAGTVLACQALQDQVDAATDAEAKRNLLAAIKSVSERLGNTPAVCRKSYIHPAVLEAYLDGSLGRHTAEYLNQPDNSLGSLKPEEDLMMTFLQGRSALATG